MHELIFYEKENGESPVLDYIKELQSQSGKDSRVKLENAKNASQRDRKSQKRACRFFEKE